MPEDEPYLTGDMVIASFKYPWLLNSMLAMSALDIAMCGEISVDIDSRLYVETSLKYYDLASEGLRGALGNVDAESYLWVYLSSFIVSCLEMALPQCMQYPGSSSMLQHMSVLFDLFASNGFLGTLNWEWMMNSPAKESVQLAAARAFPQQEPDSDTKQIIDRMVAVVERVEATDGCNITTPPRLKETYQRAVALLRLPLLEEPRNQVKGFAVAVPMYAGAFFAEAVKEGEPIALFLLMHWGVLMERLAGLGAWWAISVGKKLVSEISEILVQTQPFIMSVPDFHDAIQWARGEVGLPAVRVDLYLAPLLSF